MGRNVNIEQAGQMDWWRNFLYAATTLHNCKLYVDVSDEVESCKYPQPAGFAIFGTACWRTSHNRRLSPIVDSIHLGPDLNVNNNPYNHQSFLSSRNSRMLPTPAKAARILKYLVKSPTSRYLTQKVALILNFSVLASTDDAAPALAMGYCILLCLLIWIHHRGHSSSHCSSHVWHRSKPPWFSIWIRASYRCHE